MSIRQINSIEAWMDLVGSELGESSFLTIDQKMINTFAEATGDHQWIHVDAEKAKTDSPFKSTIAHGYLTLSLLPRLITEIYECPDAQMLINYGIEDFKFSQPVLVDTSVKLRASVKEVKNLRGTLRVKLTVRLEIKDSKKPAYTGTIVLLYHY